MAGGMAWSGSRGDVRGPFETVEAFGSEQSPHSSICSTEDDPDEADLEGIMDNQMATIIEQRNAGDYPPLEWCLRKAGVEVLRVRPLLSTPRTSKPRDVLDACRSLESSQSLEETLRSSLASGGRGSGHSRAGAAAASPTLSLERAPSTGLNNVGSMGRAASLKEFNVRASPSFMNREMQWLKMPSERHRREASKESANLAMDFTVTEKTTETPGYFASEGLLREPELIHRLFRQKEEEEDVPAETEPIMLHQTHIALERLVSHLFAADPYRDRVESGDTTSPSLRTMPTAASIIPTGAGFWRLRSMANFLARSTFFGMFFIVLTIYALFFPDLLPLILEVDCHPAILHTNSAVFFLFCFEFLVMNFGLRTYFGSLAFLLDLISLPSIFGDTYFVRQCEEPVTDRGTAHFAKILRSNKITRLARLTRTAKVTRLVPRLLQMMRSESTDLARNVFDRKVRRVFLALDSDQDGKVAPLDLKVFYFTILQTCSHMFSKDRVVMLVKDVRQFVQEFKMRKDTESWLDFKEFLRILHDTSVGKGMLNYYGEEIQREKSVWKLTERVSEGAAVKVCILVILLLVALDIYQLDNPDVSAMVSLDWLDAMARLRLGDRVCSHVSLFVKHHEVLLLHLDGRTYWDSGKCLPDGVPRSVLDPFQRLGDIIQEQGLMVADMALLCLPHGEDCSNSTKSAALLDMRAEVRAGHFHAFMTILCVVALLLIFVWLLKAKIRKFTEMFVNPIRSLADDMMAISSFDVLNVVEDSKGNCPGNWEPCLVTELAQLHSAFQSLQLAIRSWSKYVPPCIVERLFTQELEAQIGVAYETVSILFCDIDGFEDACRGLAPEKVLSLLSDVLGCIADVIQSAEGTVLEFIGDEVLAVFNTPTFLPHHSYMAVLAALEIHRVVGDLPRIVHGNKKEQVIKCRVGVQTARVLVGNIGSTSRMKYGLLGDAVNLAARLKCLNSKYGTRTLVSKCVLTKHAAQRLVTRPVDVVAVKGRKTSNVVFEVIGRKDRCSSEEIAGALRHQEGFRLFHRKRFREAKTLFEEVLKVTALAAPRGSRDPAMLLAQRCAHCLRYPPPSNWDGVERLEKKTWDADDDFKMQPSEASHPCSARTDFGGSYSSRSSEELCLTDLKKGGFSLGTFKERLLSDARSTDDTLRCVGEGADAHPQPACFCGWRWMLDGAFWTNGAPSLLDVPNTAPPRKL